MRSAAGAQSVEYADVFAGAGAGDSSRIAATGRDRGVTLADA